MKIGDVYVSPRHGRRYRVLRFESKGVCDVVLWNELDECEEHAISAILERPESGWTLAGPKGTG